MKSLSAAEIERRKELFYSGKTYKEIAQILGISLRTYANWCCRAGLYRYSDAKRLTLKKKRAKEKEKKAARRQWVLSQPEWERETIRQFWALLLKVTVEKDEVNVEKFMSNYHYLKRKGLI